MVEACSFHTRKAEAVNPQGAVVKPSEPVSSALVGDPASINKMETDHERQVTSISGLHIHIRAHLLTHTYAPTHASMHTHMLHAHKYAKRLSDHMIIVSHTRGKD